MIRIYPARPYKNVTDLRASKVRVSNVLISGLAPKSLNIRYKLYENASLLIQLCATSLALTNFGISVASLVLLTPTCSVCAFKPGIRVWKTRYILHWF